MKQHRYEAMRLSQKEYHRSHPWRLSSGGLFIPHAYWDMTPDSLSYWDDVGFILNGRRVMVWWQHPRYVYQEVIWSQVWQEVGDGPDEKSLIDAMMEDAIPSGLSLRKRTRATEYTTSPARVAYHERLNSTFSRLSAQGIECDVTVSWKRTRMSWATGVSMVAPIEVRSEAELLEVANLARRLLKQEITLKDAFPDFCYGRNDWLREQVYTHKFDPVRPVR